MPSNSLEQQALDRVARMYSSFDTRRSRQPAQRSDRRSDQPEQHADPQAKHPEPPQPVKPAGLLDSLMEDKEQSLIMLLLIIFMKDGADMNMILALMYLLI